MSQTFITVINGAQSTAGRPFQMDDIARLKLSNRISDQEAATLRYHLACTVPGKTFQYPEEFRDANSVLTKAAHRALDTMVVANAIDAMGNKMIANELRALVAAAPPATGPCELDLAQPYLDQRASIMERMVVTDDEFRTFCNGLNIGPGARLRYASRHDSRVQDALRDWYASGTGGGRRLCEFREMLRATQRGAYISHFGLDNLAPGMSNVAAAAEPSTMALDSAYEVPANSIAAGFEAANSVAPAVAFIKDTDNVFLQEICAAFNKTDKYAQILALFEVQPSVATNNRLAELRERWINGRLTGKRGNPALSLLTDLCASPKFAALSLEELAAKLMKVDSHDVQEPVSAWILAMAEQKQELHTNIKAVVDQHEELRAFFKQAGLVANEKELQTFIDKLTRPEIDVHKVAHMRKMRAEHFERAGFSMRVAEELAEAVQAHFAK